MKDKASEAEDRLEIDEILICGVMTVGIIICALAAVEALATGKVLVFYVYALAALFASGVFIAGWYYQRLASAALFVAVMALVVMGVLAGWESGVWLIMGAIVFLPTLLAAGMFLFADHEEEVIEHAEHVGPTRAIHA